MESFKVKSISSFYYINIWTKIVNSTFLHESVSVSYAHFQSGKYKYKHTTDAVYNINKWVYLYVIQQTSGLMHTTTNKLLLRSVFIVIFRITAVYTQYSITHWKHQPILLCTCMCNCFFNVVNNRAYEYAHSTAT